MGVNMCRVVYLNNEFVNEKEAKISIFDRGFLFADAVYEVTTVLDGELVGFREHLNRLKQSLLKLNYNFKIEEEKILWIHRKLIKENDLKDGLVYLQISRGVSERNFIYSKETEPTLVLFTQKESLLAPNRLNRKLKVMSVPDIRWQQRDIKTTQLLAASMMKTKAKEMGKDDAWMLEGEFITEGTSNNAFIIDNSGKLITRNLSHMILPGVTRAFLIKLAWELKIPVEERPFTLKEAYNASEAFITSATNFITSVVEIDDILIGKGTIGPITLRLRKRYLQTISS